uniref:Mannose-P-dolichol utilization defect 1 n=1 Tax=Strigops habroptila TaxID=2489341 RepID=A0A672UW49_STRHB
MLVLLACVSMCEDTGVVFRGTHLCPPPPVKLLQVLRVLGARSGAGLSVPGVSLELLVLHPWVPPMTLSPPPPRAWGEVLFLLLQTMTLGFLTQHLGCTRGEVNGGCCCGWLMGVTGHPPLNPYPFRLITFLQEANLPIIIFSRLLQAATNYSQGHMGQLSGVTTTLLFGGETEDPLLALTFATLAACNGLLLGQLLYYGGGGTPKPPRHRKVD